MKIADLGSLGYLPLQCFDPRYALEVRPALFATRVQTRWSDSLGRYVQEGSSSGDVLCSFLWKAAGGGGGGVPGGVAVATGGAAFAGAGLPARKIPGWAFGWPAIAMGDAPGVPKGDDDVNAYANPGTFSQPGAATNFGGGFGGIPQTVTGPKPSDAGKVATILPVYDAAWTPDTRFSSKDVSVPPNTPPVAKGTVGLAFAGTRELGQEELFFPLDGTSALIAPHFNGDFWRSTHVYDLDADSKKDQTNKAKLHQLLRVYEVPKHCNGGETPVNVGPLGRPGNHSLALQMGTARGGLPGGLMIADDRWLGAAPSPGSDQPAQDFGVASNRFFGPLSVGTCSKHLYWPDDTANTKRERFRPLHFDVKAFWDMQHFGCGPLEFQRGPYPRDAIDNGVPTKVYLSYDAIQPHPFSCGERLGMWRWWTTTPIYKPPGGYGKSQPGQEQGFRTYPGLSPDPNVTLPGDGGDPGNGQSTPEKDPDPTDPTVDGPGIGQTDPSQDGHFTTDPSKEAFQSQPGTLADPGQNASHNARDIGIGGLTTPETDPWDGPTHTGPQGPYDGPQGGQQPGAPIGHMGGKPFGFNFLEDVVTDGPSPYGPLPAITPLPPSNYNAAQNARAKAGVALDFLSIPTELATSGLLLRAPALGGLDYRNYFGWGANDVQYIEASSPVVARLEPWAQTQGGMPVYNNAPGGSRYNGESSGGLVFYPPSVGGEQIFDGKSPSTLSAASFLMYSGQNAQTYFSIGTPDFKLGGVKNGYRMRLNAAGTQLAWDQVGGAGDFTNAFLLDSSTGTAQVFGSTIGSGLSPCFYGDASDGTGTADGGTAVPGMTRVGSVYTMTRDVFFSSLTVSVGVTIKTGGYRIHVNGTLTNAGNINNDGGNGAAGTAGGTAPAVGTVGGTGGVSGGSGVSGSNGGAGTSVTNSLGGNGGAGGNGDGGAHTGGAAGTATTPTSRMGTVRAMPWAALGGLTDLSGSTGGLVYPVIGGASGGAGGGNSGNTVGGRGGGAGGGVVAIFAKILNNAAGTISSNGGAGSATTTGAGAGGGGGGGLVIAVGGTGSTFGTITATGGIAGTTSGTGSAGTAGSNGTVVQLCG